MFTAEQSLGSDNFQTILATVPKRDHRIRQSTTCTTVNSGTMASGI